MANATPASIGRVNASGSEDALFLKVFSGEVLTAFERSSVTQGAEMVRSISNGKSASFPVMGRIAAAYHTPGAEIVGSDVNHNEKVITINDLLISKSEFKCWDNRFLIRANKNFESCQHLSSRWRLTNGSYHSDP